MTSQHDVIAMRIAQKYGVEFNRGPGPDVIAPNMDIEVETMETIDSAYRDLQSYRREFQRHRKPVYIAGVDDFSTKFAILLTQYTKIGVMDQYGNIREHSAL